MPRGQPIALSPPFGGRPYNVPGHLVQDDQLSDARNVYMEDGALRDRRGFSSFAPATGYPAGGVVWSMTQSISSFVNEVDHPLLVLEVNSGGTMRFYGWRYHTSDVWNFMGIPADASPTSHTDRQIGGLLTSINTHGRVLRQSKRYLQVANGTYPALFVTGHTLSYYDVNQSLTTGTFSHFQLPATYTDASGIAHFSHDIILASGRVVLAYFFRSGRTFLAVSDVNAPTTFAAGINLELPDTQDVLVGFAKRTANSFYVLKSNSVWIASGVDGASFPFRLDLLAVMAGPASQNAIVETLNGIAYISHSGDIVTLTKDGVVKNVGVHIQDYLISTIRWDLVSCIHGAYVQPLGQIWWFFVDVTTSATANLQRHAIVYDMETETAWVQVMGEFDQIHASLGFARAIGRQAYDFGGFPISLLVGTDGTPGVRVLNDGLRQKLSTSMAVRQDGGGTNADGSAIDAMFQTPIRAYAGAHKKTIINSYLPFFRKEASAANLVTIEFLGGDTPTALSTLHTVTVNPSDVSRIELANMGLEANWVSIKHSWQVETDHSRVWDGGILHVDGRDDGVG